MEAVLAKITANVIGLSKLFHKSSNVKYNFTDNGNKSILKETVSGVCFAKLATFIPDLDIIKALIYVPNKEGHKPETKKLHEQWGEYLKKFKLFQHPAILNDITKENFWTDGIKINLQEPTLSPDLLYCMLCLIRLPDEEPAIEYFCLAAPEKLNIDIAQAFLYASRLYTTNNNHAISQLCRYGDSYGGYGGEGNAAHLSLGSLYYLGRLFHNAVVENDTRCFIDEAKKDKDSKVNSWDNKKLWNNFKSLGSNIGIMQDYQWLIDPALSSVCNLESLEELKKLTESFNKLRPEIFKKKLIVKDVDTTIKKENKNVIR